MSLQWKSLCNVLLVINVSDVYPLPVFWGLECDHFGKSWGTRIFASGQGRLREILLRRSESLESLAAVTALPVDRENVDGIAAPANRVQKSRSGVHYRPVVLVPSHRIRCRTCHCLHFVQTLEVTLGDRYQLPAFSNSATEGLDLADSSRDICTV